MSYAIIATFIRTGLDLLKVPELLVYLVWRLRAKTRRQKENALRKVCGGCAATVAGACPLLRGVL